MNSDRRNLLKIIPIAASTAIARPSLFAQPQARHATLSIEPRGGAPFRPLQRAILHISEGEWENGTVLLLDGAGHEYARGNAKSVFPFTIGGALGRQTGACQRL